MTEPTVLNSLIPRGRGDVAAMALAVQANLAALKVAWSRRVGIDSAAHEIRTPPPGAIRQFRETLIDREALAAYSDEELGLRTRQVWGEFCALCWVLGVSDPQRPPDFHADYFESEARCPLSVHDKLSEVQAGLWRLRFEQRFRFDPSLRSDPRYQKDYEAALATNVVVYGHSVRTCANEALLLCSCEYAGMLAALRWVGDSRWAWAAPGIMALAS